MADPKLLRELKKRAHPFQSIDDLSPLTEMLKDKKVVMLGGATHGTKEFYKWRYLITKELISNHGFHFITAEANWPPSAIVNRYIHGNSELTCEEALSAYSRWPTWLWANFEMSAFIEWMKEFNMNHERKVGFFGLDVYSLFDSIDRIKNLSTKIHPNLAKKIEKYFSCFDPYNRDEMSYARSLLTTNDGCTKAVLSVLKDVLNSRTKNKAELDLIFDIQQNARIVKNAERFYRAMVFCDENSWNVRDKHMMDTLKILHKFHGEDSKSIVWEHNTHIGDYRATDMMTSGQISLGGLARQEFGDDNVSLVGFSTYKGSVIASNAWDGPMKIMKIPRGRIESIESEFHSAVPSIGSPDYFLIMDEDAKDSALSVMRGHRAIGVVYHPDWEHRSNYVSTSLANRYNAFIYIDQTEALSPFKLKFDKEKFPETFPSDDRI